MLPIWRSRLSTSSLAGIKILAWDRLIPGHLIPERWRRNSSAGRKLCRFRERLALREGRWCAGKFAQAGVVGINAVIFGGQHDSNPAHDFVGVAL
jgi:hypothetical protein